MALQKIQFIQSSRKKGEGPLVLAQLVLAILVLGYLVLGFTSPWGPLGLSILEGSLVLAPRPSSPKVTLILTLTLTLTLPLTQP